MSVSVLELKKKLDNIRPEQKLTNDGKIKVNKKAWGLRIVALVVILFSISYTTKLGLELNEPLIILSIILPVHSFLILFLGWVFYQNPASIGKLDNALVSVIVPIYNQKNMIGIVFDAILHSTYKNIEVVAINDGSTDGSDKLLDEIGKKYKGMVKVIHKKNEGKRKAVAEGFNVSKGKYCVLIDSDSVVDKTAIEEFVKAFSSDPGLGALVGHAKVWNSEDNLLTKLQDVWYDYFFNIRKTTESVFGTVLCCSGCLAAYRRESIEHFISYWANSPIHYGDDRELTSYTLAPTWAKSGIENMYVDKKGKKLSMLSKKALKAMSEFDDAEDRALTAQSLISWKAAYVASAIVYTDVPKTWKIFVKQQKRWKKGTARVNFFVSTFFWKRNPLVATIFYLDFMSMFSTPLIVSTVFIYTPIFLDNIFLPIVYLVGMILPSLVHGFDYRFRDSKRSKNWKFKPIMDLLTNFVTSWLIFPALWSFRKNEWLTR